MVVTKSCCLCINLRLAGYIVGIVDLCTSISLVGLAGWALTLIRHMFHKEDPNLETNIRNWTIIIACVIAYFSVISVICVVFLYGVHNKKKYYLIPWLITKAVSLVLYTLFILIVGGFFLTTIEYQTGVIFYGCGVPFMGFCLYIWICMFSLYQLIDYQGVPVEPRQYEMEYV